MKFLKVFAIVVAIVINMVYLKSTNNLKKSMLKTSTNNLPATQTSAPVPLISTNYWLLKYYPGKDPIKYLDESWSKFEKKYFILNANSIYYGRNEATNAIIEESIDLKDVYNKNFDSAAEGKCCHDLQYLEFPTVKLCDGKPCDRESDQKNISDDQRDSDPFLASYCLDLFVYKKIYWRICHWSKDEIQKLRIQIVLQAVKSELGGKLNSSLMTKILQSSSYAAVKPPVVWNWMEQETWGGLCDSKLMQSPVALTFDPSAVTIPPQLMFTYGFGDSLPVAMRKNQEEVVVDFLMNASDNGFVKVTFGTFELKEKEYNPYRLSFRFPGEHLISGNRYDGEFLLHFNERVNNDDKKMQLTNGLVWVIPMQFDPDAHIFKELELLNPDFWKFELDVEKSYRPIEVKTGKEQYFDLKALVDRVTNLKTDFAIYLGSETTPPCLEHTLYIVNLMPLKIPNCQFKIFRENSLITNRVRETHARKIVENNEPPVVYKIRNDGIKTYPRPIVPKNPEVVPPPLGPDGKPLPVVKVNPWGDKVPVEVDRTPNCELKREMSR